MALDPRIALAGNVTDIRSAITGGLEQGEMIRQKDVRDQILSQEAEVNNQTIEQRRREMALNSAKTTMNVLKGLENQPIDKRATILAQNTQMLIEAGVPVEQIYSLDLTNNAGLRQQITQLEQMTASVAIEQKRTGVGDISLKDFTADSVQNYMDSGQQDFSLLDRIEKWTTTELPDGTKVQISNLSGEIRYPATPQTPSSETDTGVIKAPSVLTPEKQLTSKIEAEAQLESSKTKAIAEAKQDVAGRDPLVLEQNRKANVMATDTIRAFDELLASDRLDDITGVTGGLPTLRPKTKDLLNTATQLASLLTQDNLDIMSGVLSESDMGIIRGISNDLGFEFDKNNNVTGFSGSYDGTVKKIKRIKNVMIGGMNANGYYMNGQTAVGLDGEIIIYSGDFNSGQWVDKNGVPIK